MSGAFIGFYLTRDMDDKSKVILCVLLILIIGIILCVRGIKNES